MMVVVRSYNQYCSVAKALDVIGDRWTLLVVRELFLQDGQRYTDLLHGLPGIATNLLSDRLRELEEAGIVWREAAPPPVATTLYHLTDAGQELEPVIRSLGRWGARYMTTPEGDESFRSHWMAFPVAEFLQDSDPSGPPVTIEARMGEERALVELSRGKVGARTGTSSLPDLVLDGDAPVVLGVLLGILSVSEARKSGLRTRGSTAVLRRLRSGLPGQLLSS